MIRMILIIFGIAAVMVGLLGFRGQLSANRPWHVFLDMKYQAKYTAQGQSAFFADGRASRRPMEGTIPYTGATYRTDAGDLAEPDPDFLRADTAYYFGRTGPDKEQNKKVKKVTEIPQKDSEGKPLFEKDGKPAMKKIEEEVDSDEKEMVPQYVERIPAAAIQRAGGWKPLLERGRERYTINCAVCHGDTGYGGAGDAAHGILGRKGMAGIANYHDVNLRLAEKADGYLYDVITNGAKTMSAYGHMIKPQDRWAIVAYVRALMLSQNAPVHLVPKLELQRLGGKK